MKQKLLLLALTLLLPVTVFAKDYYLWEQYDFEVDGIYYKILSDSILEVGVSCERWDTDGLYFYPCTVYSGNLVIPSEVTYNGISYAVTSIHWNALMSSSDLESITIPASISDITMETYGADPNYIAYLPGSNGLKIIKVVDGNPVFDSRNDCNAIIETSTNKLIAGCDNTVIPNSVTSIGKSAFINCRELNNVNLPNSITTIGISAFAGCSNLTEIEIPNSVTEIGSCAFMQSGLTECILPSSVSILERGLFAFTHFTSIEFPNSITEIRDYAFYGCSDLTSVTIPNSVTSIGRSVFSYYDHYSSIVDVTCKALIPPSIYYYNNGSDYNTFHCYQATLYVPRESKDTYRNANGWKQFNNIRVFNDLEINGIYYYFTSDSTVCVTFKDENYNSYSGDIVIPESVSYNGKDYIVNAIDEKAFYNCSGLTSVIIPNTITAISNYAFNGCSGLTGIDIPNSITLIGNYAFRNCTGLLNVSIPDSVSSIGAYSFYGCSGLSSLTIGKSVTSIGNDAFNSCNNLKELTWNAINCPSNGNMSTSNIEQVTIGLEVVVLPNYFVSGSKISKVTIPNSVTWIGFSAFSGCSGLTSIEIPNSVTSIGYSVFENCSSLTNIELSNSITTINPMTFYGCSKLKSINIPDSVKTIGYLAFKNCSSLMSVNIPSSVTTIGFNAFLYCNVLSKVIISNLISWNNIIFEDATANPLYYSHHLFLNGQEIKQLVILEGVTSIGNYAFVNGTSFLELILPNTLESIGNYAFEGCKRLSNVALGFSMKAIGSGAFKDCTAISSVTCMAPIPPTMAGLDCFDNDCYDWATLYVPGDKVDEYKSTIYWNKFVNTFGTGIEVDGLYYLFDLDKGEATVTYKDETYCSYMGEVTIPETVNYGGAEYTVTGIGKAAFAYCDELTSVAIPNTVTSIGDYAFMYCEGLTSITISKSVISIGDNSFDGCGALCAIEIPNSVTSIGSMAFQGCTNLTDITIGIGVTSIGSKAFNYCNEVECVTCMGSVPPLMDNSDCFTSHGYEATLKVPQTSIEDYQSSNYWYKFAVIEGFGGVEPGDVDGDGNINISDVTALIDLLISGGEALPSADVDGDGQVNISDVTAIIDMLLSGN